jgi:hypothetical protein
LSGAFILLLMQSACLYIETSHGKLLPLPQTLFYLEKRKRDKRSRLICEAIKTLIIVFLIITLFVTNTEAK